MMSAVTPHVETPLFSDGLGDRVLAPEGLTGELLQVLHLRPELTAVPAFEFALRERAARLANFRHAAYARVRRIDRTHAPTPGLAIVSDHIEGTRLSELLRVAEQRRLPLDINAAVYLIEQLVPAVALLHENARDAAHGLIAPERLVVTPQGRLVIVEYVLGSALEQGHYGREKLWHDFRVTVPATAGLPRFDHRADVAAIGMVALALFSGRLIARGEYPHGVPALLAASRAQMGVGIEQPLPPALRGWIARALQLEVRRSFASASEAAAALTEVLAAEPSCIAAPVALEAFLRRYSAALLESSAPAVPAPEPLPIESAAPIAVEAPPAALPTLEPAAAPEPVLSGKNQARGSEETSTVEAPPRIDEFATEQRLEVTPVALPQPSMQALSETAPAPAPGRRFRKFWLGAAAAVLIAAGVGGYFLFGTKRALQPAMGVLVVQSSPAGVPVFVNGEEHGVTPARISLAPGSHILELRRGVPRVIPLNITAGSEVTQYLEFAEVPLVGALSVRSEPAGARVFVDGTPHGVAPITIPDLPPGDHEVVLQTDGGTAKHTVTVQAGAVVSLVAPVAAAAAAPVSGWLSVKAPFRVEILEQGRLIGTSAAERLMLAAGRHDLEIVNEVLGYRTTRTVQVAPGKTVVVALELPRGTVSLNATPWAEVWIAGERVGETPIGNLSVPIGAHEIVFRHPQLGEKRHAVTVTLGAPVRVSMDMR